ncbi:MAG: endospore germination permease [Bacillota bacterium]
MKGPADRGRISSLQGGLVIVSVILPWAVLFVPFLSTEVAKQDAWLSAIPMTLFGLGISLLTLALGRRFPGKTLIGIIYTVLGKPIGFVVGASYVWWFVTVGALTARGFAELINTMILPRTPMIVVLGSITLVTATAVRSGIEVMVRTMQVVTPAFLAFLGVLGILSLRDVNAQNLLPVLENGVRAPLQGAYVGAGFFGESIVGLMVVLPFLNRREQAPQALIAPIWFLGLLGLTSSLWYISVLGPEVAGRLAFPAAEIARFISIAAFLERLEALAVAFWMLANFAKLGVGYYAAATALGELLDLPDFRPLTWPVGLLIAEFSVHLFSNQTEFFDFIRFSATPYMALFELLIPLLLWAAASGRRIGAAKEPRSSISGQAPSRPAA